MYVGWYSNQEARTVCEWCMEQVALEPECLANCWKSHLCKVNPTVTWAYHIHTMAYHIQPQLFATWECNQLQLVWNRNFVVFFLFSFLLLLHQSQQNFSDECLCGAANMPKSYSAAKKDQLWIEKKEEKQNHKNAKGTQAFEFFLFSIRKFI